MASLLVTSRDFSGVQFPAGKYQLPDSSSYTTSFEHCVFAHNVKIAFARGISIFKNAKFLGATTLGSIGRSTVKLESVVADGTFTVNAPYPHEPDRRAAEWSLAGSHFHDRVDLSNAHFVGSLNLEGTVFHAPVQLDGTEFPQQTTGQGLQVIGAGIDKDYEGSYRAARVQFSEHHNRDLQGKFYSLEKRCQRKGLPKFSPVRITSRIYDEVAEYGHDYIQAFKIFLLLQLLALEAYWFGLPGPLRVDFDRVRSVCAFTVAQLVKPFELFSAKEASSSIYQDALGSTDPSVLVLAVSILHSLASLILIALIVLALRWRFRRD